MKKPGPMVLRRRIEHELADVIAAATGSDDEELRIQSANIVVAYFCRALQEGRPVRPDVLAFIDSARSCYAADPTREIGRALGMVRRKRVSS